MPVEHVEKNFERVVEDLISLARIPGVSAPGFPAGELRRSAERVAELCRDAGLENVEILEIEGAHPYVYADWLHAEGAPTLLLYAHHDVQPPGRESEWISPAFEPTPREDGRLYGRGIVDDKAGFMVHQAAIKAWLRTQGKLPVNVKLIVEGEEETGSEHLEAFLAKFKDRFSADAIVLTDTSNFDVGHPAITYALRGIVVCDVEVRALKAPLHSGMWGGPVPDPAMALSKMLARLTDANGAPAIPGLHAAVREPGPAQAARLKALPYDEAVFRRQSGVLEAARLNGEPERSVWERLWTRPSLTVHAIEVSSMAGAINQIVDRARARVSVRTVPDMDPKGTLALLEKALTTDVPWGLEAKTSNGAAAPCWITTPEGPAFDLAAAALEKGFGVKPAFIGCGGTIPFVGPFAKVLGGVPALLIGVEDPYCNAHSENESLHLGDFKKSILSAVHLYRELARL